jgi:serine/threonine protein kinase
MARIYIARTTGIGSFERHVVLKMILPERATDHTSVQMFLDEARLAASLNHQNVAQVFEVGEDGGIHFLAMEYVHGQDLRALLAMAGSAGTRIPIELALTVAAGAAAGLNHAHERRTSDGTPMGIVHRDVSPSNIMIGYDGAVKLLDFGIAKATSSSVETQAGIIKGKFAYMSPEQCRGREVDPRSDVFSLGIILYEVTTQHRCFRADNDFDTMHRIVTGDVVRPTRLVQGYPQALEAIVMKALAVDSSERYQSAGLLLEAVESFALAGRMSLSTMSLGRFMREMFGDHQEPWLEPSRVDPDAPREQTISNTNGAGSQAPDALRDQGRPVMRHQDAPLHLPPGDLGGRYPDSDAASPRRAHLHPGPSSHGSSSSLSLPPRSSSRSMPAMIAYPSSPAIPTGMPDGSQQLVVQPFSVQAGSDAAHRVLPIGTQPISRMPGFTAGPPMNHSELSYPRYDGSVETDPGFDLKPRYRLLSFVVGAVVLAVIVLATITFVGSSGESRPPVPAAEPTNGPVEAEPPPPGPASAVAAVAVSPEGFPPGPAVLIDAGAPAVSASISLHVVSSPPGADVLLAGKPIGTTPLDTKIERTVGFAMLTIHRARFEDITLALDRSEDFTREVTLTPVQDPPAPRPPAKEVRPAPPRRDGSRSAGPRARLDRQERSDPPSVRTPPPAAARCQPPDRLNPFDTSCDGEPCPPCR